MIESIACFIDIMPRVMFDIIHFTFLQAILLSIGCTSMDYVVTGLRHVTFH